MWGNSPPPREESTKNTKNSISLDSSPRDVCPHGQSSFPLSGLVFSLSC